MTSVASLMTPAPTIGADVPIAAARSMMSGFGAEHLAVRREGRVVGTLSAANVDRAPLHCLVVEKMTRDPVIVAPNADASEAFRIMAARGSRLAVVVNGERVVGLLAAR